MAGLVVGGSSAFFLASSGQGSFLVGDVQLRRPELEASALLVVIDAVPGLGVEGQDFPQPLLEFQLEVIQALRGVGIA